MGPRPGLHAPGAKLYPCASRCPATEQQPLTLPPLKTARDKGHTRLTLCNSACRGTHTLNHSVPCSEERALCTVPGHRLVSPGGGGARGPARGQGHITAFRPHSSALTRSCCLVSKAAPGQRSGCRPPGASCVRPLGHATQPLRGLRFSVCTVGVATAASRIGL